MAILATTIRIIVISCLVPLLGCKPTPSIDGLDVQLAGAGGLGEPIRYSDRSEPTDLPAPAGELTLPQAVELALRHSPELQAALARVRIAQADAKQTRLLPNPVLSLAVRFPDGGGKSVIEASLSAELLSLLQRPRQQSAADARLRAACEEAVTAALDIVADVQQRFLTLEALNADAAILAGRKKLLDQLVVIAEARQKAGEAGRLDTLTLEAQRAELTTEILETDAELLDQRLAFARRLGHPASDTNWKLARWTPPTTPGSEQQWIRTALQHRPDIQSQTWELAALGDEAAIAKYVFAEGTAGVEAERDGDWTIGPAIDLPLPVFDWGQARRDRATAQVIEARHKMTATHRTAVEEVRRAWGSLAASRRVLDQIETELIPLQEKRREQTEAQFKNGAGDVTAVLLAEQDAQASQSKLVEARKNTAAAYVRLQRAVGGAAVLQPPTTQPNH